MRRRALPALIAIATLCLLLQPVAPAHAAWTSYPWLTFSAGYENDRLLDPGLDRYAVPGGALAGVTPGIRLGGPLGARARMDVSGQLGYERFADVGGRAVLGAAVEADLRVRLGGPWTWRTSVAGSRYTDSAYETADRVGGGLETALGLGGPGGSLELVGGVEGRRYDGLVTADDAGLPGTYTESGLSYGLAGTARAGGGGLFSARLLRQTTDARDPLYDSDAWLAQASARAGIGLDVFLTVSALGQLRTFSARTPPEDDDSYWQVGVGLDRAVTPTVRLSARYAYARLTDPLSATEDLHRATLALTVGLGPASRAGGASDLSLPGGLVAPAIHEQDARLFRCHAPGAGAVALVGDFNGWDAVAHPMAPAPDGWWQIEVRLPAGSYLYSYVVDGIAVTPADAEVVVDDGFGGKNGLIRVEETGP